MYPYLDFEFNTDYILYLPKVSFYDLMLPPSFNLYSKNYYKDTTPQRTKVHRYLPIRLRSGLRLIQDRLFSLKATANSEQDLYEHKPNQLYLYQISVLYVKKENHFYRLFALVFENYFTVKNKEEEIV